MTAEQPAITDDGKGRAKAGRYDVYFRPERRQEYSGRVQKACYAATFFDAYHGSTIGQHGFRTRADAEQWALTRKG